MTLLSTRPLRILVVDDDPAMVGAITALVGTEGHQVITAYDGLTAVKRFREEQPDLVLLDLAMPGPDGFTVAGQIRAAGQAPILVVSGESGEAAKVQALGIGADDYLVKPFGKAELLARIAAVMRRVDRTGGPADVGGPLDGRRPGPRAGRHEARVGDVALTLTPTEFRLLEALVRAGGDIVPHHRLARAGWPAETDPDLLWLKPHLARLRAKVEGAGGPAIVAVRGVGYRIEAETTPADGAADRRTPGSDESEIGRPPRSWAGVRAVDAATAGVAPGERIEVEPRLARRPTRRQPHEAHVTGAPCPSRTAVAGARGRTGGASAASRSGQGSWRWAIRLEEVTLPIMVRAVGTRCRAASAAAGERQGCGPVAARRTPAPCSRQGRRPRATGRRRARRARRPRDVARSRSRAGEGRAGLAVVLDQPDDSATRAGRPSRSRAPSDEPDGADAARVERREVAAARVAEVGRPPVMPAPKFAPTGPRTTTTPPVMYSQPCGPMPSTTASAPLLRTAKRMPGPADEVEPAAGRAVQAGVAGDRLAGRRRPAGPARGRRRASRPTGPCRRSRWPGRRAAARRPGRRTRRTTGRPRRAVERTGPRSVAALDGAGQCRAERPVGGRQAQAADA